MEYQAETPLVPWGIQDYVNKYSRNRLLGVPEFGIIKIFFKKTDFKATAMFTLSYNF